MFSSSMEVGTENFKFLGIYGILDESFKLIHKWRKIFTQITLAFILPLSLTFFAHMEIFNNFFIAKITDNELPSQQTQESDNNAVVSSQIIYYLLINFAFLITTTILSLFATATVIYAVVCIYMARDVSFKHVIKILPKVWKRLLITSLCYFLAFVAFNFVAFLVLSLTCLVFLFIYGPNSLSLFNNNSGTPNGSGIIFLLFLIVFYFLALLYLTIIWKLSIVVCIVEESCGFKAMAESKKLLEGKIWMVSKLYIFIILCFGTLKLLLYFLAFCLAEVPVVGRGILGINLISESLIFFLVKPVVESVVYFVCKSHHHESIKKLTLLEPLSANLLVDSVLMKEEIIAMKV